MTCTPQQIVTRPPSRRRGESAADYRNRVAEWERDLLEANRCGYRQISTPCGLSVHGAALIQKIAQLSYARGFDFHPIELSERIVAALLQCTGSRAHRQAREILDELLALGVLVQEESARGRRPGLYRLDVAPYVTTGRRARDVNGRKTEKRPLSTGTSSRTRLIRKKEEKRKEGQPSAPPAPISPSRVETGGAPPVSSPDDGSVSWSQFVASLPDAKREELEQSTGFAILQPAFDVEGRAAREKPRKEPKQSQSALLPPPIDPAEHERRVREQAARYLRPPDSRPAHPVAACSEAVS